MRKKALIVLAGLSVAAFIPGIPSFVRAALGFLQVLYLPGALFLFLFWDRRSSPLDYLFVAPLFSGIVLSVLVASLFAITRSLDAAISGALLIVAGLFVVALALRRDGASSPAAPVPRAVLAAPLVFGAFVGLLYALNPFLLVRSDMLHHAPIVDEILERGIPPLDPRLPSARIQYMWFYHLFVACIVKRAGISVLGALAVFNTMTAVIFPYLFARVAGRYARRVAHVVAAQCMACVGLASASWILWPVCLARAARGEVRGHGEIVRMIGDIDLDSQQVIYFLTPFGTFMVNMIDRFLTISAFNFGIDLFLLFMIVVLNREFQERARLSAFVATTVILAGALLSHVVTGVVLIGMAIGMGAILFLGHALFKWERAPRFALLLVPASGVAAALACMPYFLTLSRVGADGGSLGRHIYFGTMNALTVIAPMIGLFFIVRRVLRRIASGGSPEDRIMLSWLLCLLALVLFVNLPGQAELKFALLFLLVLAVPVSIELVDWIASRSARARRLALIWIAILFAAPAVLASRGFLLDAPRTAAMRNEYKPDRDRLDLFEWIWNETDSTAVVVEYNTLSMTPLFAHRHVFLPPREFIGMQFYKGEDIEGYTAVHGEIFSPQPVSGKAIDYLRALNLDFYVVVWAEDLRDFPYLAGKYESPGAPFVKQFENRAGAIYRVNTAIDP